MTNLPRNIYIAACVIVTLFVSRAAWIALLGDCYEF